MREISFDILKAIAIFFVIVGHTIQYLGPTDGMDSLIFGIIYSFHMPLFVAISGYFANRALQLPVNKLFVKKLNNFYFQ